MKKRFAFALACTLGALVLAGCGTTAPRQRFGGVIELKEAELAEYKKLHANAWPELLQLLTENNLQNYSVYLTQFDNGKYYLFQYFEHVGTDMEGDFKNLSANPVTKKWWAITDPMQIPLESRAEGEHWKLMEEVFHMN